jgi:hypothetical protein
MSDSESSSPKKTKKGSKPKTVRFDKETGAIFRDFENYGAEKKRGFGKTKELDEHPLLKGQLSIITGPTGSGKTMLALNLLDEIFQSCNDKKLGKIMFYTGSPQDKAIRSLDEKFVTVYGPENEQSLVDDLRGLQADMRTIDDENKPLNILVLDDTGASKLLAPSQVKGSCIGEIFVSHRHLSLHVMVLAQRVKGMLSPFLLANMSHLFLFPGKAKSDADELFRNLPLNKEQLEKCMSLIAIEKYQFLHVNLPLRTATRGFSDMVLS